MNEDAQFERELEARARSRWNEATDAMLAEAEPEPDDDALVAAVLDRVQPVPTRAPSRSRGWVAALAIAAGIVLVWSLVPRGGDERLPAFNESAFEGGQRSVRGTDGPREAFTPDSHIRWAIAPETSVDGPVDVRVHAVGPSEHCLTFETGKRVAASGAVELQGAFGTLFPLETGEWELTMLVGRPEIMERSASPCALDSTGARPRGVSSAASRSVRVQPSPSP